MIKSNDIKDIQKTSKPEVRTNVVRTNELEFLILKRRRNKNQYI
jgi:hypothetical protein